MFRTTLTVLLLLLIYTPSPLQAQPSPPEWGEVAPEVLEMEVYEPDPDAGAVILSDVGEVRFRSDLEIVYERHTRIKLLNESAFEEWATVQIPFLGEDGIQRVRSVEGQTFVPGPEGPERIELGRDAIYEEDLDGRFRQVRFTLPGLEPGAVIEYRYVMRVQYPEHLPDWSFQSSIPTRYSEYQVEIPQLLNYVSELQGTQEPDVNESDVTTTWVQFRQPTQYGRARRLGSSHQSFRVNADRHRWVMHEVPALREEPYMTSPENYRAKILFQLVSMGLPQQEPVWQMGSWQDTADRLLEADRFGGQMEQGGIIAEQVEQLLGDENDPLARLEQIYSFVQTNIRWNGEMGYLADASAAEVLQRQTGSSPEIALTLTSLLREAGIEAHPVLISTRSNGEVQTLYPQLYQFNDVLVFAQANDQGMLLDATDPQRPFFLLPTEALNGVGWLVHEERAQWIEIHPTGGIGHQILVRGKLHEDGSITGEVQLSDQEYGALQMRHLLEEEEPEEVLRDRALDWLPEVTLSDVSLQNEDVLDTPLEAQAAFEAEAEAQVAGDMIYFRPFFGGPFERNPFEREDRSYPVDLAVPRHYRYILNLELPEGYEVQDHPGDTQARLDGFESAFARVIGVYGNRVEIRLDLLLQDTHYPAEAYSRLRAFFSELSAVRAEQIVLRKVAEPAEDEDETPTGAEGR